MTSHVFGFGNNSIWIALFKTGYYIRVQQMNSIQLIPQRYPKKIKERAEKQLVKYEKKNKKKVNCKLPT